MSTAHRTALVTGGAKGIGAAIVEALVAGGAAVTAADRDRDALAALAGCVPCRPLVLDVTRPDEVADAFAALGPVDILVNNAGADQHSFFTETGPEDWARLIAVNLVSVLACTHAALPAMQRNGFGRIVNVTSEAGRQGSRGGSVYAAAKGGVIAFTKSIARENARYGITANAVAPGPIRTPMLDAAVAAGGARLEAAMADATAMRRLGEPGEVAAAIAFLCSDAASYITGETLGVSGGMGMGA